MARVHWVLRFFVRLKLALAGGRVFVYGPRPRRGTSPGKSAPVAQLDRAPDYESGGWRFDSFRARHFPLSLTSR
ncbi:protein of unknown function [Magnetospirillum sp. XM-1]|nr:protein of unknown function [Magnetospirillum sp. XM-1]